MFRLSLKMTLARKGRLFLTSLAIILGTGFLSGTFIFSDTINQTFNRLFTDVFKDVDAYVRSSQFIEVQFGEQRSTASMAAYETVMAVPGVKDVAPDIQAFARIVGKDGKPLGADQGPPTFGGIASQSVAGLWTIEQGKLPVGPNEMAMDKATAETGNFVLGDRVNVNAQSGSRAFTLVGIASYGDVSSPGGATFALFDQPTASEFLLKPDTVDAFLVQGDGSKSDEELVAAINAALDPALKLETLTGAAITKETTDQIGVVLGFLTTFLTVFSLIALGIGCFVIYNVFSITIAQRLRENALFRAIGATRKQVTSAMLVESLIIGVIGSFLGFLSGIGLSKGLSELLNAAGIDIPTKGLSIQPRTVIITMVVGTIVTVLSAVFPSLRAGRVPPLAALRDTALENIGSNKKRFTVGITLLALGVVASVASAIGAPALYLGFGIVFVFAGVLVCGPGVAKPVALALGRPIEKFRGVTGSMARQNAARNPKRTARTAAPVLIGVALVTAFTAFATSAKKEIRDTIGSSFRGDFAVSAPSTGFGGLSISLSDQLGTLPEVAQATGIGFASVNIDGQGKFVQVINPATASGLINFTMVEGSQSGLSNTGMLVSTGRATANNWKVGSTVNVSLVDGASKQITIEGIYEPTGFDVSYVLSRDFFTDTTTRLFDNIIYIKTKSGVSEDDARTAISSQTQDKGLGKLQSRSEYIDAQSGQVNQILGLIYGLLFLSIIIAIVGIIITLLLSVFERKREIGLLRAIGMTKNQVRATVRWESAITSMLGAVVGVVLGVGMGLVLIAVLADTGVSAFSLPVNETIVILVLSFIVGVVAAVYPAWKATKVNIMMSITTS
ncbi:MAG: FtsX-like permease family protein [Actinobacteria bacterium]|nr:FtsX-like permease family protein [Actinomycetota bacterium]